MLDDDEDTLLERVRHGKLPNWDGKLLLAAMIFIGYFFIMYRMLRVDIPAANMAVVKDQMLVIGPVIGLIAGALFRNTLADERREQSRSGDLRQAMTTTALPPQTVAGLLPPPAERVGEAVEEGARAGVADGIDQAVDQGALTGLSPAAERITIPADGGKEIIS